MDSQNLLEIAEQVYRQIQPQPNDEVAITKQEIISTAKTIYAETIWRLSKEERNQEGFFNVPSNLISQTELEVGEDGKMSIEKINPLRSLPDDSWILNIGGMGCECRYVKTTINLNQCLCDDDSLGDNARTYLVIGNDIFFPKGIHKSLVRGKATIPIIYANLGSDLNEQVDIAEGVGNIIRQKLQETYLGKVGTEDTTNNSSATS